MEPLSLEAQRMLIKAKLQRDKQNSMYPNLPTSNGNIASYVIIVRQDGVVVEGRYTLGGVSPSAYTTVTCIYFDNNNIEITRSVTEAKPGFCMVSDVGIPGVAKLEMQVHGIYSAPTGGHVTVDGTYLPTRAISNYGNMFGGTNSEICTSMNVNPSNIPSDQIKVDSYTGALTWNIVPKRVDSNSFVRVQKVVVETSNGNIGTITITPYARQNNDQIVELNSISGQANSPIRGFPNDYYANIFFFAVKMFPFYSGSEIDPNQVLINVYYCSVLGNPNTSPILNGIQPYYTQNSVDNSYNQLPRIFTSIIFLNFFFIDCF
jgi:hypothetical protein